MKKSLIKVIGLLIALVLLLTGCNKVLLTKTKYSTTFSSSGVNATHEVGAIAVDGGWGAGLDAGRKELVRFNDISLNSGYYLVSAQIMTDSISEMPDLIMEIYIYKAGTDEIIDTRGVLTTEFNFRFVYESILLPFALEKDGKVDVSFVTRAKGYVRVKEITLSSIAPGSYQKTVPSALLAHEGEQELVYDENKLYVFDARKVSEKLENYYLNYDFFATLSALQAIVNREKPTLFVYGTGVPPETTNASYDSDVYWFEYLNSKPDLLGGYEKVTVKNYFDLFRIFKDFIKGVVVWDINVPATVNAAFTTCGIRDYIPLSNNKGSDSMYYQLIEERKLFDVKLDFTDKFTGSGTIWDTDIASTGSKKNDVYYWAMSKYIDTNVVEDRVNPSIAAIYMDSFLGEKNNYYPELTSIEYYKLLFRTEGLVRDYFISNRGFFFDLSPWGEFIPNDDKTQKLGTDLNTLHTIMGKLNKMNNGNVIKIGGFVPWMNKYANYAPSADPMGPEPVASEWKMTTELSYYMGVTEADGNCNFANATIFQHFAREKYDISDELKANENRYSLEKTNVEQYLDENGKVIPNNYFLMYMGDYDSPSWLYRHIPYCYDDTRGKYPLAWCVDATNIDRASFIFEYMYENATPNDYFVSGNNGYGYLDPFAIINSERPADATGTLAEWKAACKSGYEQLSLDFQGFMIPTSGMPSRAEMEQVYKIYAELGIKGMSNLAQGVNNPTNDFLYYNSGVEGESSFAITSYFDIGIAAGNPELTLQYTKDITDAPAFNMVRTVIASAKQVNDYLDVYISAFPDRKIVPLDPYTFYALAEIYEQQKLQETRGI